MRGSVRNTEAYMSKTPDIHHQNRETSQHSGVSRYGQSTTRNQELTTIKPDTSKQSILLNQTVKKPIDLKK